MLLVSVFSSLETDRSHIKAKLLVVLPKVGHFDVQQGELFHLGGVDLQDASVQALPVLQRRTGGQRQQASSTNLLLSGGGGLTEQPSTTALT